MSKLGVKTVDELVGRTDLLKKKNNLNEREEKVDLSLILNQDFSGEKVHYNEKSLYDFKLSETIDEKILSKKFNKALRTGEPKTVEIDIKNTDRSLGTALGSEITVKYGNTLQEDTYKVICKGSGGQSFGAFIPKGLTLELKGDSNDYFGKGLSGGKLIVYPPENSKFKAEENIIVGNVALYGATSGKAFINGIAGERFCVRNSGATAVSMFLSRGDRDLGVAFQTHRGDRHSSRVEAKKPALLSSRDGYLLELTGWTQGSQAS